MSAGSVSQSDSKLQAELLGIALPGKPATSKASAVLSRVFIIVVLTAIPLLYYFGYIGIVWLNRIGVILNFCAGFMVAPELIGNEGLRKIQLKTTRILFRLREL